MFCRLVESSSMLMYFVESLSIMTIFFRSGMVAERIPIRYFLSSGMLLSGIFTAMFGLGYFANVHVFSFYIIAQASSLCL